MAIENPYRSLDSQEKRTPARKASSGVLFAQSRVMLTILLLICAAVIFVVHEFRYDGSGGVKVEYKEALNRLRGTAGGTLGAKTADLASLQGNGGAVTSADTSVTIAASSKKATGLTGKSEKPSGGGGAGNLEANTKEMGGSHPIPVTEKETMDSPKINRDEVVPAAAREDKVVHHHSNIHKVVPEASSSEKTAEAVIAAKHAPVPPHPLTPPVPPREKNTHSIHVPLDEAPDAKHLTQVQADTEKKKERSKELAKQAVDREKARLKPTEKPHNIAPAKRPKNPYDLKPSAKRARADKAKRQEAKHENAIRSHGCDGTVDPFEGQPVDSFEPPETAAVKDKMEWNNKVREMMKNIKAQKIAGSALRKFMDDQVDALKLVRMSLFCETYVKENGQGGNGGGGRLGGGAVEDGEAPQGRGST